MKIEFNINEYVWVKLTKHGKEAMERNHKQFWGGAGIYQIFTPKLEDKDGWSKWQMWNLMEEFGNDIRLGGDNPFETTILLTAP